MPQSDKKITRVGIIGADNTVNQFDIQVKAENIIGNVAKSLIAEKLENIENLGSYKKPVYFINGVPTECNFTVETNVPENAVFTDTTYQIVTDKENGLMSPTLLEKLNTLVATSQEGMTPATSTSMGNVMVPSNSGLAVNSTTGALSLSEKTQSSIDKIDNLNKATDTKLGLVKIGNGITMNDDGQISVSTYNVVDDKNNGLMSSDMLKSLTDIQASQTAFNTFILNTNSSLERMDQDINDRPTNATLTADINTLRTEVSDTLADIAADIKHTTVTVGQNTNYYDYNSIQSALADNQLTNKNYIIEIYGSANSVTQYAGPITIDNPITLIGKGNVIINNNTIINNGNFYAENITFLSMTLNLSDFANITFKNCSFYNCTINNIKTNLSSTINFINCEFRNNTSISESSTAIIVGGIVCNGFTINSPLQLVLTNCKFYAYMGNSGLNNVTVTSYCIYLNDANKSTTIEAVGVTCEDNSGIYGKNGFDKSGLNWNNKITALNN